jgi:hypothetical protein
MNVITISDKLAACMFIPEDGDCCLIRNIINDPVGISVCLRNVGSYLPALKTEHQNAPKVRWLFSKTVIEAEGFSETLVMM